MENIFVIDEIVETWADAIRICSEKLFEEGFVKESYLEACLKREEMFPTGLPTKPGVAIPHAGSEHVHKNGICLLRLKTPVLFQRLDAPDETVLVHFVYSLATSETDGHIEVLKRLMETIHDETLMSHYMSLSLEQLHDKVYEQLNRS